MIVLLLSEQLLRVARLEGGMTLCTPMDVVLSDDTILQPDLLYIARSRRAIVKERVEGPPDIVVEILSPATAKRDRLAKQELYARHGVPEFWIVDPGKRTFEFMLNQEGDFAIQTMSSDSYQSPLLPKVRIELTQFWGEFDQRLK